MTQNIADQGFQQTHSNNQAADDEIDIRALLSTLWRQRGLIIAITLASILIVGLINVGMMALPKSQVITATISFNFQGAEKGEYPDGSPFSQRDLTANDILSEALNRSKLDISVEDLRANLVLTPGTQFTQAIEARLNEVLASAEAKKAPPESVLQAAGETLVDAQNLTNKTATLALELQPLGLSETKGTILIKNMLEAWSNKAANEYGVLVANLSLPRQIFTWDKQLSIPVNIDALAQQLKQIDSALKQLTKVPGIQGIIAEGSSLDDLTAETELLRTALVRPLQNFVYNNYWAFSVNDKTAEIQVQGRIRTLESDIQIKHKLIENYTGSLPSLSSTLPSTSSPSTSPQGVSSVDSSFINQMMEIGGKLGDTEFRNTVLQKRLIEIENIADMEEELALLSGASKGEMNEQPEQFSKTALEYIEKEFPEAIRRMNQLQQRTLALLKLASVRAFGIESNLFNYINPPQLTSKGGMLSPKIQLQFALGAVLGLILGCLVALSRGTFTTTRP